MFGISGAELLIILIFAFIIFGPDKLPQIAKTVGKAIAKFREVQTEAKETVNIDTLLNSDSEDAVNETIDNVMKLKDKAIDGAREVAKDGKEVVNLAKEAIPESMEVAKESLADKRAKYDELRAKREEMKSAEGEDGDESSNVSAKDPSSDREQKVKLGGNL